MSEQCKETIEVVVTQLGRQGEAVKGKFFKSETGDLILTGISTETLKENLSAMCGKVAGVLEGIKSVGKFELNEVTLQVEITAEAGISLVGTSKIGGKGGMVLKFVKGS